jgi:hypothetical protein
LHLSRISSDTGAAVLLPMAARRFSAAPADAGFPSSFQWHGAHRAALAPSLQ